MASASTSSSKLFCMDKGKRSSSTSSNYMIYRGLREIVRENALQFLPAKSLLRFRGVCRDWNFLISTPFFAHTQSNSFRNVSGFFSQSPAPREPSFISVDPSAHGVPDPSLSFLPEAVAIRSSSEGLLCCQGRTDYNAYYICNLVTKNWHKLPKSGNNHGSDPAVVLIFKPSVLNFTIEYTLVGAFHLNSAGMSLRFTPLLRDPGELLGRFIRETWKSCDGNPRRPNAWGNYLRTYIQHIEKFILSFGKI